MKPMLSPFVLAVPKRVRVKRLSAVPALAAWLALTSVAAQPANPPSAAAALPPAASERARQALEKFPSRGARGDFSIPPLSPKQSAASFQLMPGLEADCVLHEPDITQPVFLNFDARGRLWVVEFRQYPYPAGLAITDLDDQFHAAYNRVPPPPPRHDRGADRITIHEDKDGDGSFETHKTFLDGLNMATSVEHGRGGVWVLHPPYLLFYPDANADDAPDADPIVHLAGFGLEDTHSAANSLRWGPDGWLYGATGSGVSANIVRPGLDDPARPFFFRGQTIWRYHPERRAFELFAEGGGNTFCVEFDAEGRCFSGLNGAGRRGFHFVQGGYYSKNWGEHGYLTNPHAFGYFNAMSHPQEIPRFSHAFIIYHGAALDPRFEGKLIAPVPLHHHVALTERSSEGSTFRTLDIGRFLETNDRWFRPVDIKTGPDGAIYLADWYDTRLTHMDPRDTWDRAHGRIHRIRRQNAPHQPPFDLSLKTSAELADLLAHPNKWWRDTALRLLADRRDRSIAAELRKRLFTPGFSHPLETLWALHAIGALSPELALSSLRHPSPPVREWTIRLIGDSWTEPQPPPAPDLAALPERLILLAQQEPNARVRSQLAATARRLPGEISVPITLALARRSEDVEDPHLPLLIWWALEAKAESHRDAILQGFADSSFWAAAIVREHLVARLSRRWASLPAIDNQKSLAAFLNTAPSPEAKDRVIDGINQAFKGGDASAFTRLLQGALEARNDDARESLSPAQLNLALRGGDPASLARVLALISTDGALPARDRLMLLETLGETRRGEAIPILLQILARASESPVRAAALHALGSMPSPNLGADLIALWPRLHSDPGLRRQTLAILCSRKPWAKSLLDALGSSGAISKTEMPDELVERIRGLADPGLTASVERFFGKPRRPSSDEKLRQINVAKAALALDAGAPGDPSHGKTLFQQRCAACHQLFGEGGTIGPDLTPNDRTNLDEILLHIIDPNAAIREGFAQYQITTHDDRVLVGFIHGREGAQLTLRDVGGQLTTLAQSVIREEKPLPTSLMPEGLLDDLAPRQIRDFFSFFMSRPPPSASSPPGQGK